MRLQGLRKDVASPQGWGITLRLAGENVAELTWSDGGAGTAGGHGLLAGAVLPGVEPIQRFTSRTAAVNRGIIIEEITSIPHSVPVLPFFEAFTFILSQKPVCGVL